ncbi:glycosyltransferase family 39 protein [Janthinobacterium sp.]|uniref:glycosyltransferase family 39 protein n=1 Tax=Janthinobacterium sp. TaxID=1871054 RepID=UPI00293D5E75|nr:glycosyltransferase family 39 protein [Janthinobacterium sp.]
MNDLHNNKTLVWSLLAALILISLYMLGYRTLVPPDEGRYAEMAREMLASGDWITTRLNGIKYFEKPPLQTWMNALSFAAFGLGDWQARLWTGVCGLLGVVLTAHAGRKVFGPRVGLYAGLILGSSLFWVASGQIDSLDMSLSGMMAICLCALLIAQRDDAAPGERRNWMLVCWAGMALAVLAKGLIGLVLPGAVLVLYTLAARDWAIWGRLHLGKGLLLFFAVAAPWFVLVGLKNPEQPHFFFIHEHFERFLLKTHHREGAWYYFFAMLIPGIMPWLGLLPQSLAGALRRAPGAFQPKLMLLVWAVFIFFFFSYSSSKLPGYILPIFPALALLLAAYLETASRPNRVGAAALLLVVGAAGLAFVPQIVKISTKHASELVLLQAYQPWVLAAAFVALAGGALALLHARHLRRDMTVLTLACAGFLATQLILAGFEPYGKHRAGVALVERIQAELAPDTKIYSVGTYEQSLTFYLRRTVTLVDYRDEFTFGLQQQPELSIPTVDAFVVQWTRDAQAGVRDLAIVSDEVYADLQRRGVPLRLVAQDSRRIVVANR